MDISNINETLLKGIQQAQIEQVQLLTKVLGVKIGDSFLAQVTQMAKASPEERAQLAEQIAKTLSQLNPNSAAPATKALINQLLTQQAMVQSGDLKLVTLNAQGVQQQPQTLLTYTTLPLEPNQPLLLKLDANQRLVILGLLAKEGLSYAQLQTLNPKELTQYLKPLFSNELTTSVRGGNLPAPFSTSANFSNAVASNAHPANAYLSGKVATANLFTNVASNQHVSGSTPATPQILDALRSSVANLLPRKDIGQDLLTNMQWLTQQIQKMPLQERNQWFSSELQQALKTLASHLRSPQDLSHPKILASALRNSGVFFEQKLTGLIPNPSANSSLPTSSVANTTSQQIQTQKMELGNMATMGKNTLLSPDKLSANAKNPDQIIKQDLKGALLGVLHQIEEELDPLAPLLSSKSSANSFLLATQPQLVQLFAQLTGMLSTHTPHKDLNLKTLRAQLMMLLQQHTLGSLAKIQLQQIHAMNHQLDQADSPLATQSWQFEIPIRHGQDIHHVHMQMEYQWVDDEKPEGQQSTTKTKQWQVTLGFNRDAIGQFYVQLILLGNNLSANFWAERSTTLEKTRKKLDELQEQLEREGIHVNHLQCLAGLPPKPKMTLGYSLVDIKT